MNNNSNNHFMAPFRIVWCVGFTERTDTLTPTDTLTRTVITVPHDYPWLVFIHLMQVDASLLYLQAFHIPSTTSFQRVLRGAPDVYACILLTLKFPACFNKFPFPHWWITSVPCLLALVTWYWGKKWNPVETWRWPWLQSPVSVPGLIPFSVPWNTSPCRGHWRVSIVLVFQVVVANMVDSQPKTENMKIYVIR